MWLCVFLDWGGKFLKALLIHGMPHTQNWPTFEEGGSHVCSCKRGEGQKWAERNCADEIMKVSHIIQLRLIKYIVAYYRDLGQLDGIARIVWCMDLEVQRPLDWLLYLILLIFWNHRVGWDGSDWCICGRCNMIESRDHIAYELGFAWDALPGTSQSWLCTS